MWDEKYNVDHYVYGIDPNHFLQQNFDKIPGGKVLCLGEGEGRNAVFLSLQGYQVTAVDLSSVGLGKAQKLASKNNVEIELIHQDLAHFDPGLNKWDGVVSIFCHLPEALRRTLHAKIVDALKPQGVLLLEAYTPEQLLFATGGPPVADMMMTRQALQQELAGLKFSYIQELQRDVIEGSGHTGKGAVVQLVAIKD